MTVISANDVRWVNPVDEMMCLDNDGDLHVAGTVTADAGLTTGSAITPLTDDALDLGTSSLRWRDVYTGGLILDGSAYGKQSVVADMESTVGVDFYTVPKTMTVYFERIGNVVTMKWLNSGGGTTAGATSILLDAVIPSGWAPTSNSQYCLYVTDIAGTKSVASLRANTDRSVVLWADANEGAYGSGVVVVIFAGCVSWIIT